MATLDLSAAAAAVDLAQTVVADGIAALAAAGSIDENQVLAYDLAHAAAAVETARALLDYGAKGDDEARITCAFVADAIADLVAKLVGREAMWGTDPAQLAPAHDFVVAHRDPAALADLADVDGPRHLEQDFEMVQDTFRRFADEKLRPVAEHIHRANADIPEDIISGLAEMGAFGLSVPEEYGGFASGGGAGYPRPALAPAEASPRA